MKPGTLRKLQRIVTDFAYRVLENEVRKGTGNIVKRASACLESGGGLFEFKLKKKRASEPEE